jgi:PPM family protein phosphatase
MIYQFAHHTDPGLARDNNEDSVALDLPTHLAVLAAFIKSEMGRWLVQAGRNANAREVRRALEICVDNANRSIFNAAGSNPQYTGMGTTLVVGVFQEGRLMLGHIGDSRCYRLRGQEFSQITKDHSLLQEQIDAGLITPEQAATSLNKNLVTRALGVEDAVLLETNEHRTEVGDIYLMCSDGLSDMVSDEGIADIMRGTQDQNIETMARALVDAANAGGGRDNISVLLALAKDGQSKRGFMSRLLRK